MSCAAIIASRGPTLAKSRLASLLPARTRIRLVAAMLDRALDAARGAHGYGEIILVSPLQHDLPNDVTLVVDHDKGLNAAFALACSYALARGHRSAALIPADLPRLETVDLEELLRVAAVTGAAIAGDLRGQGTNALVLPLPLPIDLIYDGRSFSRHLMLCRAAGLSPGIVQRPGFAFDLDGAEDLALLEKTDEFAFLSYSETIE